MKNIVLTGGGTAGHIMPNIALLPALRTHFDNIYYIGANDSMEEKIAKKNNLPFYSTPTVKFVRGKFFVNAKIPFVLLKGISKAKNILKELKPSIVFSKGGYCALPAVLAAKSLSIPVVCHESDITIGLANRVTIPIARAFITSFESTSKKGICLGTPIRKEIFEGNPNYLINSFKTVRPIILVLGGSLGSKTINECVRLAARTLTDYNILHISGDDKNLDIDNYQSFKFVDRIEDYYAASDIVISRAGASTLAELTALGKKTLAIPLPQGASRGDQVANAAFYRQKGLINVLPQEKLTPYNLIASIKEMATKAPKVLKRNDAVIDSIVKILIDKCKA